MSRKLVVVALLAIAAIFFLFLFTFERMIYVTVISRRDEELRSLRQTKV